MFLKKHLDAFNIYIVILVISSSVLIRGVPEFPIINFITYLFIHILLIYVCIYHFRTVLYFIYFITGIIFDIFLLNELGTHILTFMILILILSKLKKLITLMSSKSVFVLITIILFLTIICEMLISFMLFNFSFEISNLFKSFIAILLISYPVYYLFNKIDKFG